jgi:hypothetical protein
VSRVLLSVAGVAALVGAGFLDRAVRPSQGARASDGARAQAPEDGSALEALGRALGGWRVLAVDVLFLRGEALRKQGRSEELPAIYASITALDPDNEAATDALAGEYADNLLATAPTADARFAWWQEAWLLTLRGLRAHPDSARLAFRASDLLLRVPDARPDLAERVDRLFGAPADLPARARREAQGLAWLLAAVRATEHLPRLGRLHLLRLARAAPLLAARALVRGDPPDHAARLLGAGAELLRLHPLAVHAVLEEVGREGPGEESLRIPLDEALRPALAAVDAAIAWARGDRRAPVAARLAEYVERAGETELSATLNAWLRQR